GGHGDESNPRGWPSRYAPEFPLVLPQARTKAIISSSRKSVPSKNTTSAPLIRSIIAAVTAAAPGVKGTEERRCRFACRRKARQAHRLQQCRGEFRSRGRPACFPSARRGRRRSVPARQTAGPEG